MDYLYQDSYFFLYIIFCFLVCFIIIFLGFFLGGRSVSRGKNFPFESGISSIGTARLNFSIKFYLIAVLFIIFDLESIYLYSWSVSIKECGWVGFFESFCFVFILLTTLLYLLKKRIFYNKNISLNKSN